MRLGLVLGWCCRTMVGGGGIYRYVAQVVQCWGCASGDDGRLVRVCDLVEGMCLLCLGVLNGWCCVSYCSV